MFVLLLGTVLTLAGSAHAASPCKGKAWAVVVGIGDYQGRLPALKGARRDAVRVAKALSAQGFRVAKLLDEEATGELIKTRLSDLMRRTKPEDRVLVYFAGHGVTVGTQNPQGYLAPFDFDPEHEVVRGLAMKEVVNLLEAMPARKRLFMADACYSGLTLPGTRRIVRTEVHPSHCPNSDDRPVTAAIVAGRQDQVAHETAAGGVFTQAFIDVLEGRTEADFDRDGWIDQRMLGAYLGAEVPRRVKAAWGESVKQDPQDGALGDGRFLLQVKGPTDGRSRGRVAVVAPDDLLEVEPPPFQYPATLALGIASLAGVALGITFWQLVEGANDDARQAGSSADYNAAKDDAELFHTLQIASYVGAGIAGAAAVAAFFVERRPPEPSALQLQVAPGYVGVGGVF